MDDNMKKLIERIERENEQGQKFLDEELKKIIPLIESASDLLDYETKIKDIIKEKDAAITIKYFIKELKKELEKK